MKSLNVNTSTETQTTPPSPVTNLLFGDFPLEKDPAILAISVHMNNMYNSYGKEYVDSVLIEYFFKKDKAS